MDVLSEIAAGFRLRFPVDGADLAQSLANLGSGESIIQTLLQFERLGLPGVAELWRVAIEESPLKTSDRVWAAIRNSHDGVLRTAYGVLVGSEKLVMEVFENASNRYTVNGYAQRMACSFGEIYLGLDDGQDYRSQSTVVNAAIGAITEGSAFNDAFAATNLVLADFVSAAKLAAGSAATWDVSFAIKDVIEPVLAKLCESWFGIPDGVNVLAGGIDGNWIPGPGSPPRCPGHYGAPSGYIFQPNPIVLLQLAGQLHGKALKAALDAFVAQHRTGGTSPTQPVSNVIFSVYPNNANGNEMIARTIIGVMMGFIPTTDGNLREVVSQWLSDQTLGQLSRDFKADPAATDLPKAIRFIKKPFMLAMQRRPVPPLVWRTALTDHDLGPEPVSIRSGDKMVISIISATQQALESHRISVFPIFGGDRSSALHPTHACPGYEAAMGVMLGVVTALAAREVSPGLLPSSMRLSGSNP